MNKVPLYLDEAQSLRERIAGSHPETAHPYRGTSKQPPPPSATVGPYACSYCRDLEGAVSYNRGTPVVLDKDSACRAVSSTNVFKIADVAYMILYGKSFNLKTIFKTVLATLERIIRSFSLKWPNSP